MKSQGLVDIYRVWHGTLHLKGAGLLLTTAARFLKPLQNFPLILPEGQTIYVDFRDVSAMYWINHLMGDTFEERGLLIAIKPFLKNGGVVWDIGANSGLLAYQLARMKVKIELHLFEPNPRMFKLASEVVAPFDNVESHEFGLSDKESELTLIVPAGHATLGTLEPSATGRQGAEYNITCRTGDNMVLAGGYRAPDVIKIDTEGHELSVISGLRETMVLHRPVVFFEHISVDSKLILDLVPPGYQMFGVSDATGELRENFGSGECHNSVLIPR
jgi:FkbM family methyltransferase